jgi:anthranilate synthase component 2/para-aminobenzoate synthetase component 2
LITKTRFTHNVVHQLSLFDDVECDDFSKVSKSKLNQASTIVFSPGPGSPLDYPISSKIYKKFKGKKKNNWNLLGFSANII